MNCKKNNTGLHTLQYAKINNEYKIKEISNLVEAKYIRRLYELGFYPNATVKVLRYSPFGKTMLIAIGGAVVLMRKDLASKIILKN